MSTLGRTGGGGTGSTVSTIQSGRAFLGSKPSARHSSSLMRFRISCAFSAVICAAPGSPSLQQGCVGDPSPETHLLSCQKEGLMQKYSYPR